MESLDYGDQHATIHERTSSAAPLFDNHLAAVPRDRVGPGYEEATGGGQGSQEQEWSDPRSLDSLGEIESFDPALLPEVVRAWVVDCSERNGTPVDLALPALFVTLGTAVGNGWVVRPYQRNDFGVYMTLWGMLVAPPGSRKSAQEDLLAPLRRIQQELIEDDLRRNEENAAKILALEQRKKALEDEIFRASKSGDEDVSTYEVRLAGVLRDRRKLEPRERRLLVHDATVEKVAIFESFMPRGITVFRDELPGFFDTFSKRGREGDEAYYLQGWNAANPYQQERIGRGTIAIERHTISVGGNIQNTRLEALIRKSGNDSGLLQRFQATVVMTRLDLRHGADRYPDTAARRAYEGVVRGLYDLSPQGGGQERALQFTSEAYELYKLYTSTINDLVGATRSAPGYGAHLSKYYSFLPAVAGLYHLVELVAGNRSGLEIDATVVERATKTVEFFERHAQRLYGLPANPNVALAKRVLKKLRQGDGSAMTVRELYRHLGVKLEQGQTALALLEKSGYIRTWTEQHERGGQPKRLVVINPKLLDVPELS